jgi:dTDP-4-dehydrorhamnose reductase
MPDHRTYRVAITGSNGQLGRELASTAAAHPLFHCIFLSRGDFPLDEPEKMKHWLDRNPVDVFIHAAAYTAVDKAESEKEKAFLINASASGQIASHLSTIHARLIYMSTDYVFDGHSSFPLTEHSPTNPINWYGATKLEGERLVLQNNRDSLVIRTSWLYSAYGNNFVKTMMRLMGERTTVKVVQDQIGSPTYAVDLAEAIWQILESEHFLPGIYHYSNEGEISWFDLASEIKRLSGSSCEVMPIPSKEFPTTAIRPHYSLLDKSKIKRVYGLLIPDWKTSLALCMQKIKQGV